MGLGFSIFLVAVGAIMRWGVTVTNSHGFDINTIGLILMAVGVLGILLSMIFWSSWGGMRRRRTMVEDPGAGRRVYTDEVV